MFQAASVGFFWLQPRSQSHIHGCFFLPFKCLYSFHNSKLKQRFFLAYLHVSSILTDMPGVRMTNKTFRCQFLMSFPPKKDMNLQLVHVHSGLKIETTEV